MEKKYRILWTGSLLFISGITLLLTVCNILRLELPDLLIRVLGVVDLIAIPILIYSSLKLRALKKEDKTDLPE